ncbi:unnamed protein product, partial [Porites lobata]
VLCPRGWLSSFHGVCFKVHSNDLDWNSAKSACEALGSSLAVPNSKAKSREFPQLLKRAGASKRFWIGLYRDPKNERRWLWVDGSTVYITSWNTGEPNNARSNEDCGEIFMRSGESKWNDETCSFRRPYICEINGNQKQLALPKTETFNNILKCLLVKLKLTIFTASMGKSAAPVSQRSRVRIPYKSEFFFRLSFRNCKSCPHYWTPHQSSCYKLSSNTLEWIAAKFACKALGSNLAMLDSPTEQREIGWGNRTWIGLHRDSSNNSRWQWIDGSLAVYLNFANQSNKWNDTEDCVEMYPSRKWNVLNCNTSLHYSCELSSEFTCRKLSLNEVQILPGNCVLYNQRYGSICSFSCATGKQISGPSSVRCGIRGYWSEEVNEVSCNGSYNCNFCFFASCYPCFSLDVSSSVKK